MAALGVTISPPGRVPATHAQGTAVAATCSTRGGPNMVVFGEPGRGKSSTVVAFLLRMMLFGVKTLISGDVKGEYSTLARALGITPIALGRGSPARLNALDLGPLRHHWGGWPADRQRAELDGVLGRWVTLLVALAEAQGYRPTVTDEAVLSRVLRRLVGATDGYTGLRPVTIPDVQRELANPDDALWDELRFAGRRQQVVRTIFGLGDICTQAPLSPQTRE